MLQRKLTGFKPTTLLRTYNWRHHSCFLISSGLKIVTNSAFVVYLYCIYVRHILSFLVSSCGFMFAYEYIDLKSNFQNTLDPRNIIFIYGKVFKNTSGEVNSRCFKNLLERNSCLSFYGGIIYSNISRIMMFETVKPFVVFIHLPNNLNFLYSHFFDTHREKLCFTQFSTRMAGWLLLTFFICLHNKLSSIHSSITY